MKISATAVRLALAGAALCALSATAEAQYQRTVLLEEYTSVTCVPCATAGRNINAVLDANASRLVTVRYHTNFIPSPKDRFYEANKSENDARRDFYQWAAMPAVRIDGATSLTGTNRTELETRLSDALAVESPVQLTVTHTAIEGGAYRVTVTATAGGEGIPSGQKLRVVAVESEVHDPLYANSPYNGEVDVRDIMRRFLTGTTGVDLELAANETKEFSYTYTPEEGWQTGQMHAVAFVQDEFDQTVLQAGFSPRPVSSVDGPELAGYAASLLSANPATGAITIGYSLGRTGSLRVAIVDALGTVVRTQEHSAVDDGRVTLDVADLAPGAYTVSLAAGDWRWSERVAVVR